MHAVTWQFKWLCLLVGGKWWKLTSSWWKVSLNIIIKTRAFCSDVIHLDRSVLQRNALLSQSHVARIHYLQLPFYFSISNIPVPLAQSSIPAIFRANPSNSLWYMPSTQGMLLSLSCFSGLSVLTILLSSEANNKEVLLPFLVFALHERWLISGFGAGWKVGWDRWLSLRCRDKSYDYFPEEERFLVYPGTLDCLYGEWWLNCEYLCWNLPECRANVSLVPWIVGKRYHFWRVDDIFQVLWGISPVFSKLGLWCLFSPSSWYDRWTSSYAGGILIFPLWKKGFWASTHNFLAIKLKKDSACFICPYFYFACFWIYYSRFSQAHIFLLSHLPISSCASWIFVSVRYSHSWHPDPDASIYGGFGDAFSAAPFAPRCADCRWSDAVCADGVERREGRSSACGGRVRCVCWGYQCWVWGRSVVSCRAGLIFLCSWFVWVGWWRTVVWCGVGSRKSNLWGKMPEILIIKRSSWIIKLLI